MTDIQDRPSGDPLPVRVPPDAADAAGRRRRMWWWTAASAALWAPSGFAWVSSDLPFGAWAIPLTFVAGLVGLRARMLFDRDAVDADPDPSHALTVFGLGFGPGAIAGTGWLFAFTDVDPVFLIFSFVGVGALPAGLLGLRAFRRAVATVDRRDAALRQVLADGVTVRATVTTAAPPEDARGRARLYRLRLRVPFDDGEKTLDVEMPLERTPAAGDTVLVSYYPEQGTEGPLLFRDGAST